MSDPSSSTRPAGSEPTRRLYLPTCYLVSWQVCTALTIRLFLESYTLSPTNLEFRPHSMHESTGRSHQKLHSIFGHHFPTVSRRRKGGPASISLGIRKLRHRLRRSLCGAGTCRTTITAAHQLLKAGELPLVWTYILEPRRAAVSSLQIFGWYHRLKKESALNILMAHRGCY